MDPLGGYGIMNAFRDAELLAEALDRGFREQEPLQQALESYEARRNKATAVNYENNWRGARFLDWDRSPQPQLFAALRADEAEGTACFCINVHITMSEDFYAKGGESPRSWSGQYSLLKWRKVAR